MTEPLFLGLAGIIVLGIAAQWLAWYLRVPSIFLLLLAVIAAFARGGDQNHPPERPIRLRGVSSV
jgi:NhaP-type Na+/H+ or K+/H+ antiporter